ncbi:MAG: hypothetical protein ACYDGY_10850 [Acidimicrobiales bacterium]
MEYSPEASSGNTRDSEARLAWEAPEVAAVAVLVAVTVLIVGGLVSGIVASTSTYGPFPATQLIAGAVITAGAEWADSLVAVVLLGVIGICWWQSEAWADASEPDDEHDRVLQAYGHVRRANRISVLAQGALFLTCAGAIALLVGGVLQTTGQGGNTGSLNWSHCIFQGANLLAVLVVAGAGYWAGRQVNSGHSSSN